MTLESPSSISGARRAARVAAAAGLVAALCTAGAMPAFAAGTTPAPGSPTPVKSAEQKLGSADVELLQEAKTKGDKTVTVMVATAPGETKQVAQQIADVQGASVGQTYDKLGYVRATLPTDKAETALKAAAKLSSVHGIDLRHEIQLPDPRPSSDRETARSRRPRPRPTRARTRTPRRRTRTTRPSRPARWTSSRTTRRPTAAA